MSPSNWEGSTPICFCLSLMRRWFPPQAPNELTITLNELTILQNTYVIRIENLLLDEST